MKKCVLKEEAYYDWVYMAKNAKTKEALCSACPYTRTECPHANKILCGKKIYPIVPKDTVLPRIASTCKKCGKNNVKTIAWTIKNSQSAMIIECMTCHTFYVLEEEIYRRKFTKKTEHYPVKQYKNNKEKLTVEEKKIGIKNHWIVFNKKANALVDIRTGQIVKI